MTEPTMSVAHPYITRAERVFQRRREYFGPAHPSTKEAAEGLAHAKVTAVVDVLSREFTHDQLRTLVDRLDEALTEHEGDSNHKRVSNPFTVE